MERGEEINQEIGIKTHTLLYIKQITNKDLLYSTESYTQYLIATYNGKESGNYIYVTKSFCRNLKLTQSFKSTAVVVALVTQSCPTPCDPMDCSPPDFSVQGILQARILEWVAIPSPGGIPDSGI